MAINGALGRDDGILFLPDSFLQRNGINPASVAPSWLAPRHVILEGVDQIGNLSQVGGRAGKPGEFTVVSRGDGSMPIMLVHDEQTEAAEIEDLALEAIERKPVDFAESRRRTGRMAKEDFSDALKQACEDYVKRQRAHGVTAKPRDPMQQYVRGLVTVPALAFKE